MPYTRKRPLILKEAKKSRWRKEYKEVTMMKVNTVGLKKKKKKSGPLGKTKQTKLTDAENRLVVARQREGDG